MKVSRWVFPLFLLISLVTYYPTIGAGFVHDFLGWQIAYNAGSFADILNCFGYPGNHQVLHLFFYSIYSIFHIQGLPWYIIFCSIHAFNAWLLFGWVLQITSLWKISISALLVMFVSILFIIHPYNVEAVVWKTCLHYLLSLTAVLGILRISPIYVNEGKEKLLWVSLLIYASSLFLLEISFVTPLVMSIFFFIHLMTTGAGKPEILRSIKFCGGLWGLLVANILLNKLTLGAWVGHYGADKHLSLDVIGMMSTEVKYFVKHLFEARFFSFKTKSILFDQILSNPELIFFLMTILISILLVYVVKIRKIASYWHLVVFGFLASLFYVLPVANMFFYHLQVGMNDRYSYLSLTFLLIAVIALMSQWPKWLSHSLMAVLLLINIYLQEKTNQYWAESTKILTSLKSSYRWNDNPFVFILNSPDNLNGITMTSIYDEPSGIDELIDYQTPRPNTGKTFDVFQFNMGTPQDGVDVIQTGPLQLKVNFKQWGNWWHRHGIGASSYENEYYKAEIQDLSYVLTFKQFPEGSVILYIVGDQWNEFHWK